MSLAFESLQLVLWQRIEEGVRHLELAAVRAELALRCPGGNGSQARHRRSATENDDLLAGGGTLDQAREMRLGSMDCHAGHAIRLA